MTKCPKSHGVTVGTIQSGDGEGNGQEVALEAQPEDTHRRRRSDGLWQTVPYKQHQQKSLGHQW